MGCGFKTSGLPPGNKVKIFGNFQSSGVAHQIDKRLAMKRLFTSVFILGLFLGLSSWAGAESTPGVDPEAGLGDAATASDAVGTTATAQTPVAANPNPASGVSAPNYDLNA